MVSMNGKDACLSQYNKQVTQSVGELRSLDESRGAIRHLTISSCFVWRCGATDRTIAWQQNSEYALVLQIFDKPRA
jgi:hypothetical protein